MTQQGAQRIAPRVVVLVALMLLLFGLASVGVAVALGGMVEEEPGA